MEDLETVLPGGVQAISLDPARDSKTGIITLKLRVVGPRDRAVDLVENLEHSKHFMLPSIVGESMESAGGPAEKLEAPSASNRVNFELQAQYNPDMTLDRRAQKKTEKPAADGERAGHSPAPTHPRPSALPPHVDYPAHSTAASGQKPMPPAKSGAGLNKLNGPKPNSKPNLKPGGPR
jgi:type IV pilus assembly protein PilN